MVAAAGDRIGLPHGGGGVETEELILYIRRFFRKWAPENGGGVDLLDDGAFLPYGDKYLVFTIDTYTVKPVFFPGGDIGVLAAAGTLNDLAVMGARPIGFMDTLLIEEGFPRKSLEKIIESMAGIVNEAGAALLGGDIKVMPRGGVDEIAVTGFGVGVADRLLRKDGARIGDLVIVTGPVGDHGAVVLAHQLGFETSLRSDARYIGPAIEAAMNAGEIHAAKDPTRGGLAMALNEIAEASGVTIIVWGDKVPVREETRGIADIAGVDPLALASEGQAVIVAKRGDAEKVLSALHAAGYTEAAVIGEVVEEKMFPVLLETGVGGLRILEKPSGEIVPRIC